METRTPLRRYSVTAAKRPGQRSLAQLVKLHKKRMGVTYREIGTAAGLSVATLWELVHSAQVSPTLDTMHSDLYRGRAAALSMIPTSTGAAKAIGLVLPHLKGKLDGVAVRAPVATGSLTDLVLTLRREVSRDELNAAYAAAAAGPLAGILRYSDDPLVSSDIVHSPFSCIFDSGLTMAHGATAKVFGWYDNEWGYSCRLVDLVGRLLA